MSATLTLDADVATLLERAQKEHGRSLEELGNELLRRMLRQLGTSSSESESAEPEAARVPDPSQWLARVRPHKTKTVLGRIRETRGGKLNSSKWGERMTGTGEIADQIKKNLANLFD